MTVDLLPFVDPYRVGWRSTLPRSTARRMGRNRLNWLPFRRPWQCEVSYGRACNCSAVRAFTRRGAMARMDRMHDRRYARGACPQPLLLWPYDGPRPVPPGISLTHRWPDGGWQQHGTTSPD